MTNLKSERRSRKPVNILSILLQSPHELMLRGDRVKSDGEPLRSSTNSERAVDVMVERLFQRGFSAISYKLENGVRNTMDLSELFSRRERRPSGLYSGYMNQYAQSLLHRKNEVTAPLSPFPAVCTVNSSREFAHPSNNHWPCLQ